MFSIYFGFFILGLVASVSGPIIPWIVEEFSLSFSTAGSIFLLTGVGRTITSLYIGMAEVTQSDKQLVLRGVLIMAGGCLVVVLMPSFVTLLISAFIWGFGWSFLESGSNALASRINPGRSGVALNRLHLFFGVGALVGPLVATTTATVLHWRFVYLWLAVFFSVFFFWLSRLPVGGAVINDTPQEPARNLLRNSHLWLIFAVVFFYVSLEVGIGGWLNTYWGIRFNSSQLVASWVLTGFWIAITAGRFLVSMLVVRYSRTFVLQIAFSLVCASFLLLHIIPWAEFGAVLAILIGLGLAGTFPTVASLALDNYPGYQVPVSGLLSAAAGMGLMIGPWFAGILWDLVSIELMPLWGLTISVVILMVVTLLSGKRGRVAQKAS